MHPRHHRTAGADSPMRGTSLPLVRGAPAVDVSHREGMCTVTSARHHQHRTRLVAAACASTALVFVALWLGEAENPVRMPVLPFWATAGLAGSALLLVVSPVHRPAGEPASRFVLGVASCAALLLGNVAAIPHTVLMIVVWSAAKVTGGTGSFEVDPVWAVAAGYLLNLGTSLLLGRWLVLRWRERRDRCRSCGREDAAPPRAGRGRLPWLATAAVVACLPYGLLKLAWGLGSRIGLTGHAFDDVSFASPGFGDTVVLTLVSVAACVVMGAAVERRIPRIAALAMGGLGSLMLLPVGAVGTVTLLLMAFTDRTINDSEIAPWAFVVVFVSFLSWGAALSALTLHYWRATSPACDNPTHQAARTTTNRGHLSAQAFGPTHAGGER